MFHSQSLPNIHERSSYFLSQKGLRTKLSNAANNMFKLSALDEDEQPFKGTDLRELSRIYTI